MVFGYLILLVAVIISSVAAYYSVAGLAAIFSAAVIPIIIMGGALEAGKIVSTMWLHNNWKRVPFMFKMYLVPAVAFLMFLTSMGIFGFLSRAHLDQAIPTGDAQGQVQIYDDKIKTLKDNIAADRKALTQLDAAVDQVMGRTEDADGALKANRIRRNQKTERLQLQDDITKSQKEISKLSDERAPLASQARKVEAEVGPIKYIAAFIYGDNPDQNLLERSVRWVIILIIVVFDPLALCLILAANKQFEWAHEGKGGYYHDDPVPEVEVKDEPAPEEKSEPLVEEPVPEPIMSPEEFNQAQIDEFIRNQVAQDEADAAAQEIIDEINMQIAEAVEPPPEPYIPEEVIVEPFVAIEENAKYPTMGGFESETFESMGIDEEPRLIPTEIICYPPEPLDEEPAPAEVVEEPAHAMTDVIQSETAAEEPVEEVAPVVEAPRVMDAMPHPGRHKHVSEIQADNALPLVGHAAHTDFGNVFPTHPEKGDVYLRTDFLPNRLFKFNGMKWIEVDKNQTDMYAYEEQYIKHLIEEIDAGRYDLDTLTDTEREQITEYLNKNA